MRKSRYVIAFFTTDIEQKKFRIGLLCNSTNSLNLQKFIETPFNNEMRFVCTERQTDLLT